MFRKNSKHIFYEELYVSFTSILYRRYGIILQNNISWPVLGFRVTRRFGIMSILQILEFPNPNLRKVAAPVVAFDEGLSGLINDMLETMYDANGIGLAATQVDVHKRLIVLDVSEEKDSPKVLINPSFEIINQDLSEYDEGCLSVPGFYETVSRPESILVRAQDRAGELIEIEAEGVLSTCIQHEIDHLDGKLFVDYLSALKRNRIRNKLEKEQRKSL